MSTSSIARRVFIGAGVISLAGVAGRLIAMPANPFMTAHIGPHGYGLSALVATATGLASVLGLLGLETSYARSALEKSVDPDRVARFCWRFALSTSAVVGVIAGVVFAIASSDSDRSIGEQIALGAMVSLGTILSTALALANVRRRVAGSYGRVAVALVIGSLVGVGFNLLFIVLWRHDGWVLIASSALAAVVTLAILGVPVGTIVRPSGMTRPEKVQIVKLGIAVLLTAPAYWIVMSSDRWILAHHWDQPTVGIYNFAVQFGLLAQFVPMAVSGTWLPEIARYTAQADGRHQEAIGALWEKVAGLYVLTWAAVSMGGGDLLRLLSASSFHPGASVIPLVAAGATANGFAQLGMSGFLMGRRFKGFWGAWVAAAVFNIALNLILVPYIGVMGAALSNATAMIVLATYLIVRSQIVFPLYIRWRRLVVVASPAIVLAVVGASSWSDSPVTSLLMKLPLGLALTGWVLAVIAPGWTKGAFKIGRAGLR